MGNGANGNLGMTVQDPVAVEFKHALARAPTQAPLMEVELVLDVVAMPNLVGQMLVQLMGTGPRGQAGASALSPVEVDFILVQEPAVILYQAMVGRIVRENQIRFALAAHSPVQWMVRGVTGPTGQPVPNPATRDNRRELAVVPIPHQLMAGSSVLDKLKRHRTVTFSHAQIAPKSLTSPFSWMHPRA